MEWLKSKTTMVAGGCVALVMGLQGYGMRSMRSTMEERVSSLETRTSIDSQSGQRRRWRNWPRISTWSRSEWELRRKSCNRRMPWPRS